ncbi:MAG: T9SS type A sorting domain-containing protein [Bacteroidales bacterium]|nr:T9SS type A sorting domain-containing protein [Bacteroidales bacterium]
MKSKTLQLLSLLLFINITVYSQIDSLMGVHDIDSCKFENMCQMLALDTTSSNIWEIGEPVKPFFDTAFSPDNALVTDLSFPYDTSVNASFLLLIPNYAFTNMILGFKHKYQTDSLIDGGFIEVSYDKGQSWINLAEDTNYLIYNSENLYSIHDTLKGGISGFSGTSDGWVHTRIQWVWYMLTKTFPTDSVYFKFTFISDTIQSGKAGWMIDDIKISFADIPGAIDEKADISIFKLYPNPNDGNFIVDFKEETYITLYNLQGIPHFKGLFNEGSHQLRLNHLASGLYFLKAEGSNTFEIGKILINK